MTETQVIKLLAVFSSEEPTEPFKMLDWVNYLDVTRAGWSKKKPLNLVVGPSRQKTVTAINQLQRQVLKLQGEKTVEFLNDDGNIPTGSVCIEAALLATDAANAALQRGKRVQAANYIRLACDLFSDEVRWLDSQLPHSDTSVVEQADNFVRHLLDPRSSGSKAVEIPIASVLFLSNAGSLRDQLTARASVSIAEQEIAVEMPIAAPQPLVEESATVRDLLESIAISALVICYEFAVLHFLLPTISIWQIALVVSAKAVAFRGVAFPSFLESWQRVLKPVFVVAYLPVIAVGLVGALFLKGVAWLASPIFRNAKSAA